ncbi:Hypothetical protein Tpal_1022 [Trichococcus palustris]|uniref:Uncharacterized protein n=1 Tax=Trichococcus palustris TaxID=140314 RepID=A0A143YFZ4_9LACT|nr:Hypothetical protein Tpal_1022 [Trichococcus palustris]SFL01126.1 hypothetical protein SAMN04488076_11377 [Trichococcus palustris]
MHRVTTFVRIFLTARFLCEWIAFHSCTIKGAPGRIYFIKKLILPALRPFSKPFCIPVLINPGSLSYIQIFTFLFTAFTADKNKKTPVPIHHIFYVKDKDERSKFNLVLPP